MSEQEERDQRYGGFEFEGRFYTLHVSDIGKDLMLIDRISQMPMRDFYAAADDAFERGRGPVILTLIATSLRNGNPDWTVERIYRKVMDLSLGDDVVFIAPENADEEEEEQESPLEPPTDGSEKSPSNGFSSSSVPMVSSET